MCVVLNTAPGRPGNLAFIVTTPSSVLVSWTKPSPRPNGIILLYELSYYQDFYVDGTNAGTLFCFGIFVMHRKQQKLFKRREDVT